MCDESLSPLLFRPSKVYMSYVYVKATYRCSEELFFLNKGNVFSWLWTVYSNTNVSNRSYLNTTSQRQNHLRKWSSKHQSPWQLLPASHNLRGLGPGSLLIFFPVSTKTRNDLKPPTTTYNHLQPPQKFQQPPTTTSKTSTTTHNHLKNIYNHLQTI